jgi:hypothetical protein
LFQEEYRVPLLDPAVAARMAMVQEGMILVIQTFVYPNAYNEHLV